MPSRLPAASAAAKAPVVPETPLLTFPPFPEIPEGSLVPFKDFKPSGIQISFSGDEEVELDGMGIPTVELKVKHSTDETKTGRKRKKKSKPVANDGEPPKRLTWWEEWDEGEDLRVSSTGYSLNLARVDRLMKGSVNFTEGRKWPSLATGVKTFWEQYQRFLGLLVNMPPSFRKPLANATGNKRSRDEPGDDLSDDAKDPNMVPRGVDMDEDDDEDDEDEAVIERQKSEGDEIKEERLNAFLNDPEKSMKIFLGSYMREQGLIWSERNLQTGPRLTAFFINFLLRNRVLPESNHERGLRRALEICILAQKELPLTARLGQALPDNFSTGLKDCFGRMAAGSAQIDGETVLAGWGKCAAKDNEDEAEREKKRQKVDQTAESDTFTEVKDDGEVKVIDDFETELKAANVQVIQANSLSDAIVKQVLEDNVGMDVNIDVGDSAGWGSSDNAWGSESAAWGESANTNVEGVAGIATEGASGWGDDPMDHNPWDNAWTAPKKSLLMKLLGPTTLPLTHTTGIVEQSTRRIKTIIPPPLIVAKSVAVGDGEDPEGVEEELEKNFAKIVLEPWVGEEGSDVRRPIIRHASKGEVYPGTKMEDGTIVEGQAPPDESKVHNPLQSDITLLVEPVMVDIMSIGMGLLATWIQIVRQEGKTNSGSSAAKSKKKKGKKKVPKGYWYMEELLLTLPSFYTEEKLVQRPS